MVAASREIKMINTFLLAAGLILISSTQITGNQNNVAEYLLLDQNKEILSSAECLALNMYYETRNQGTAGALGVTAVVYNRVKDKRFPNTICGVIKQGPIRESWKTKKTSDPYDAVYYPIKNRCQFSWYCDGKSDTPYDKKRYNELLKFAYIIMNDEISFIDITDGALFYHADNIRPSWAKTKKRTTKIGNHIFYK